VADEKVRTIVGNGGSDMGGLDPALIDAHVKEIVNAP